MRKSHTKLAGAVAFLSLMPFLASAVTAEELGLQIQSLLAQIATLQAQLGITPSPASTPTYPTLQGNNCPQLTRTLFLGVRGHDVLQLQQFLIAQNLLGTDSATGYFGPLTEGAVQRWQTSHGIISSGDSISTGWGSVGPRTRSMITLNCNITNLTPPPTPSCPIAPPPSTICGAGWQANTDSKGCTISYKCSIPLSQPTPTPNACTAIGFIQPTSYCSGAWRPAYNSAGCQNGWQCVPATNSGSFSASPTSGVAPLTVTFSNMIGGPLQGSLVIRYGDGLSDTANRCSGAGGAPDSCGSPGVNTHIYTSSGTYTAQLVNVRCVGTNCEQLWGTATITVSGASLGIFSASPTSGNAPLSVAFSIPSTPGQNKTLYFGDGSSDVTGCQTTAAWTTTHTYATSSTYFPYLATPCTTSGTTYSLGQATITVGSSTSASTSISVAISPSNVAKGQNLGISWSSQNAPPSSVVLLRLVNVQTGNSAGIVARAQSTSSSYTWTIPTAPAIVCPDCGGVQTVDPGSYKISGEIYTPSTAWLGDTYPPANPISPTFLATTTSSAFVITAP